MVNSEMYVAVDEDTVRTDLVDVCGRADSKEQNRLTQDK